MNENCACQHQTSVLQDDVQGVGHNVQIQDYVFVILKPIKTKISVCFDPIIYPLGSHQLAGRLVCLQLHMDSWCVPSGVAT